MNNFQSKIVEIQAKLDMDEMLANAKISKIEDKFAEKLRKHDEIISDNKAKAESKALKLEEQRREILKQLEDAKQKVYNGKTGSNSSSNNPVPGSTNPVPGSSNNPVPR